MYSRSASCPTKKRKGIDSCDDVANSLSTCRSDDASNSTSSQLDRMEQMMMKMDEKLDTIKSLESRCEDLQRKCSSLENMLKSTCQTLKDHVDRKFNSMSNDLGDYCSSIRLQLETKVDSLFEKEQNHHEYNTMLLKNQKWKYSAESESFDWLNDAETTNYLVKTAAGLKEKTIKMRGGEFPYAGQRTDEISDTGIYLSAFEEYGSHINEYLLPHLKEYIAAIKQFTPAMNLMPDNCEMYFEFQNVQLNDEVQTQLREALIGKPFSYMQFYNRHDVDYELGGMNIDDIIAIIESNEHLQKLDIGYNRILSNQQVERICSVVRDYSLVELELFHSLGDEPGVGNTFVRSLLTTGELKLKMLMLQGAYITSDVARILADFLASNPTLETLNLEENMLNDSDATLIANALRSNSNLRDLHLDFNNITDVGSGAFIPVLCDDSSMNKVFESNHSCCVHVYAVITLNRKRMMEVNRAWKIHCVLSHRHLEEEMSTLEYFADIDVKFLPHMLEAIQRYENSVKNEYDFKPEVRSLSIIYEVMRTWEKIFYLYEATRINNDVS